MSYILDALRRADSERERGAVPGVHAQPVPLGSADVRRRRPPSRTWVWVSLALAVLVVMLLGWQLFGREETPEAADPSRAAAPPPVPVPVTAAPLPAAPDVAPAAPAPAPAAAPMAALPVRKVLLAKATVPAPASASASASAPAKARTSAAASTAASAPSQAPAQAVARVPNANELPDDIQRGLPTLVVGGASYSQNPENRMLIVNGQVFREGDKVTPDVSLEQIRLKEAVLSTKGYRYRIAY